MKVLSLLLLLVGISDANAWFSFSFGNLLFATGICKVPGPRCHAHCGGPLHPKKFCGCATETRRHLTENSEDGTVCYDPSICEEFEDGSNYEQCLAHANYDAVNEDSSVNEASSESSVAGGHSGVPVTNSGSRKLNWLPFAIAGAILTMFILVAVKIRRKKKSNPELQAALDTEDDLHGGVAKRMERIESGRPVNPLRRAGTETSFVNTGNSSVTPYSLA